MTPSVTVVIALYNKVGYVKATIDSVLNQSFTNFQLIVVDDGSTDGSAELVKELKDVRLTVVTIKNSGPGVARNVGLAMAESSYVTFIDADDYWHVSFLQEAVSALEKNPSCEVWLCAACWEPAGEKRVPYLPQDKSNAQSGPWKLETDYTPLETAEVINFFATGAVVARTTVIKKYHGYFDFVRCTSGEDGYLWMQVMYNHIIYREHRALLHINTEGSDLGIGRVSLKPVPPWLAYPQPIIDNCPKPYITSLLAYFNLSAFLAFRREVYQGHAWTALKLLLRYPGLSAYRNKEYPPIVFALVWYPFKHYVRRLVKKTT